MSAKEHYLERADAAACRHRKSPVPVAFWQHHPELDQRADTLADATCAFQDRYECDLVKITPASGFQLRDLGQTDAWTGDAIGRREFGPPLVQQPEDWLRIAEMEPEEHHLAEHLAAARMIRARVSSRVPVLQSIFDPLFQARVLGRGVWEAHRRDCPDYVAAALAALTRRTRRIIAKFMETGIDGIFLAVQHAGAEADSLDEFASIGLPDDLDCLAEAGADSLNFVHLHGDGLPGGLLASYPGTTVHFSFDANPTLDEGRCAPSEVALGGGMSPTRLAGLSAGEVARESAALIRRMHGRRFTLGAGCVLLPSTPEGNVLAAISAAREGCG